MKKILSCKLIALVLILVMLAGLALSGCGMGAAAYSEQQNFITIGVVCPLSGDLAPYGEGTLEMEEEALSEINEGEGLYIDTLQRKLKVRFAVADSRSTSDGAKEAAKQLIEKEGAKLVICSSGTKTALAAAEVCEENKVPFFSVGADPDQWLAQGPFEYCFNCAASQGERIAALGDVWAENGITSVGFMAMQSDSADVFGETLAAYCNENGISFTDSGRLDPAAPNYSGAVKTLAKAEVQALICYMNPAEFSLAWQTSDIKGLSLSMCILESAPFFAGEAAAISPGAEIQGFFRAADWDRKYPFQSSLTDETCSELAIRWEDQFLTPASELLAYKHASAEVAVNALKLAMALDAESICSAARSLNVDTVLGTVDFDDKGISIIPCSVQQWYFDVPTASWAKELYSHSRLKDVEFEE